MNLRRIYGAALSTTILLGSVSSAQAITIDGSTDVGDMWNASWFYASGAVMEAGTADEWTLGETINLSAVLKLTSYNSATETFGFDLTYMNNSTGGAVMTSWGFGTDPNADSFTLVTAPNANWITTSGPSGSTSDSGTTLSLVDECATTGTNCNGGDPNSGIVSPGGTGFFTFSLDFADLDPDGKFELSDAFARFQSVDGTQANCTGVDRLGCGSFEDGEFSLKLLASTPFQTLNEPPPQVPIPAAAWLFGSGLIGLAAAKRRQRS